VSMKRMQVTSTGNGSWSSFYSISSLNYVIVEIILNPKKIFFKYVTSVRFILDILAVLPLELFSLIWLSSGQMWKFFAIFRLNRLLKFWKVCLIIISEIN